MIQNIIDYINLVSGGNQFVAGVILAAVMGAITTVVYKTPRLIYSFIKNQCTVTVTLNNGTWEGEMLFNRVLAYLYENAWSLFTRNLAVKSYYDNGKLLAGIGIGYGMHLIYHNRRFYFARLTKIDSPGSEKQKEEITIMTLGRSHNALKALVDHFKPDDNRDKLTIHKYIKSEWEIVDTVKRRGLDHIALNPETRRDMVDEFTYFLNNKEDYYSINIPWKMSILLHGKPGTGKTSLIRALASDFKLDVCIINLAWMSDDMLQNAVSTCPSNSIILFEDFDASTAAVKTRSVNDKNTKAAENDSFTGLTLSGILNTLDGISSLDGTIMFFTTNHIECLDDALIRDGRIDIRRELPLIRGDVLMEYLTRLYGELPDMTIKDTLGKDINGMIYRCKKDKTKLINELRKIEITDDNARKIG